MIKGNCDGSDGSPGVENQVLIKNIRNFKYVSVCVVLFGAFSLISYRLAGKTYPEGRKSIYLCLLMVLLSSGLCSFGLSVKADRNRRYVRRHLTFFKYYIDVILLVIMTTGSALALADQAVYGQTAAFTVCYAACMVPMLVRPGKFWKLQAVPLLLLFFGLPFLQKDSGIILSGYGNVTAVAVCISIHNYLGYAAFCRNEASRLEMGRLAEKDELTGLNNRRKMRLYIEEILKKRASVHSIGIIMFDIDYFKKYNDYYGHGMGDMALISIGAVLNDLSEQYGVFSARYGGEEFIVILRNKTLAEVSAMAVDIKNSIADLQIENRSLGFPGIVSVSIGQYWTRRLPAEIDFMTLIEKADAALYRAKREGKNRIIKGSA